eukprot:TRINITY_DN9572_c0_g1_i1.p1 TRINITY_DN9572_c0_g1~~TRINITY_DN9572_c0_g1_i1.p1  ORF type:complete len:309 (-),score=68.18 TRINITY_DN9572_c0_g1_i1:514-1404(-)
MVEGAHLTQINYSLCIDAARAFAESRIGTVERSVKALDLIAGSVKCLLLWSKPHVGEYAAVGLTHEKVLASTQEVRDMWLRLVFSFQRVCVDQREEVRNHAILSLQRCLSAADVGSFPNFSWPEFFEKLVFKLVDELIDISQCRSPKDYRSMEGTLQNALKLMSKCFLHLLDQLSSAPDFQSLWLGMLTRIEKFMKAKLRGKSSEKLQELVPELLKNMLLVLKAHGVLVKTEEGGSESLWEMTYTHVQEISPLLMSEIFQEQDADSKSELHVKASVIEDVNVAVETAVNNNVRIET